MDEDGIKFRVEDLPIELVGLVSSFLSGADWRSFTQCSRSAFSACWKHGSTTLTIEVQHLMHFLPRLSSLDSLRLRVNRENSSYVKVLNDIDPRAQLPGLKSLDLNIEVERMRKADTRAVLDRAVSFLERLSPTLTKLVCDTRLLKELVFEFPSLTSIRLTTLGYTQYDDFRPLLRFSALEVIDLALIPRIVDTFLPFLHEDTSLLPNLRKIDLSIVAGFVSNLFEITDIMEAVVKFINSRPKLDAVNFAVHDIRHPQISEFIVGFIKQQSDPRVQRILTRARIYDQLLPGLVQSSNTLLGWAAMHNHGITVADFYDRLPFSRPHWILEAVYEHGPFRIHFHSETSFIRRLLFDNKEEIKRAIATKEIAPNKIDYGIFHTLAEQGEEELFDLLFDYFGLEDGFIKQTSMEQRLNCVGQAILANDLGHKKALNIARKLIKCGVKYGKTYTDFAQCCIRVGGLTALLEDGTISIPKQRRHVQQALNSLLTIHDNNFDSLEDIISLLHKKGMDFSAPVDPLDSDSTPFLVIAVQRHAFSLIPLLAKVGASVTECDSAGMNFLHHAVVSHPAERTPGQLMVALRVGLDAGLSLSTEGSKYGSGWDLLAARDQFETEDFIRSLVRCGATLSDEDQDAMKSCLLKLPERGELRFCMELNMVPIPQYNSCRLSSAPEATFEEFIEKYKKDLNKIDRDAVQQSN